MEVDQWLGCHGYLLSISRLANHLICCTPHTCSLQWSIDKLILLYFFYGILLLPFFLVVYFLCMCLRFQNMISFLLNSARFLRKHKSCYWSHGIDFFQVWRKKATRLFFWSTALVGGIPQNYEKLCGDLNKFKHKQLKAFVIVIITKVINISHGYFKLLPCSWYPHYFHHTLLASRQSRWSLSWQLLPLNLYIICIIIIIVVNAIFFIIILIWVTIPNS